MNKHLLNPMAHLTIIKVHVGHFITHKCCDLLLYLFFVPFPFVLHSTLNHLLSHSFRFNRFSISAWHDSVVYAPYCFVQLTISLPVNPLNLGISSQKRAFAFIKSSVRSFIMTAYYKNVIGN